MKAFTKIHCWALLLTLCSLELHANGGRTDDGLAIRGGDCDASLNQAKRDESPPRYYDYYRLIPNQRDKAEKGIRASLLKGQRSCVQIKNKEAFAAALTSALLTRNPSTHTRQVLNSPLYILSDRDGARGAKPVLVKWGLLHQLLGFQSVHVDEFNMLNRRVEGTSHLHTRCELSDSVLKQNASIGFDRLLYGGLPALIKAFNFYYISVDCMGEDAPSGCYILAHESAIEKGPFELDQTSIVESIYFTRDESKASGCGALVSQKDHTGIYPICNMPIRSTLFKSLDQIQRENCSKEPKRTMENHFESMAFQYL